MSDQRLRALLREAEASGDLETLEAAARALERAQGFTNLPAALEPCPEYVVKTSSARGPRVRGGWRSNRYKRIAVMAVRPGAPDPFAIVRHAEGVLEIVDTWESLRHGRTRACAYWRAHEEAVELATRLGNGRAPRIVG